MYIMRNTFAFKIYNLFTICTQGVVICSCMNHFVLFYLDVFLSSFCQFCARNKNEQKNCKRRNQCIDPSIYLDMAVMF